MSVKITQVTREVVASTNVFRVRVQMPGIQGAKGNTGDVTPEAMAAKVAAEAAQAAAVAAMTAAEAAEAAASASEIAAAASASTALTQAGGATTSASAASAAKVAAEAAETATIAARDAALASKTAAEAAATTATADAGTATTKAGEASASATAAEAAKTAAIAAQTAADAAKTAALAAQAAAEAAQASAIASATTATTQAGLATTAKTAAQAAQTAAETARDASVTAKDASVAAKVAAEAAQVAAAASQAAAATSATNAAASATAADASATRSAQSAAESSNVMAAANTYAAEAAGNAARFRSPLRALPAAANAAEQLLKSAVGWWDASHWSACGQKLVNLGWGGSVLDATMGSVAGANVQVMSASGYVYLPGVAGNYMSVPDSAALDVAGDIDIRVKCALDDWTPAVNNTLMSKLSGSTTKSYMLWITTEGKPELYWSTNGSALIAKTATAAVGATDGATKWVRAVLDVDNGASGNDVKFYTSDDGVAWTQLGTTVTTAGVTSIFASTDPVWLGLWSGSSNSLAGKFYRAQILSGINGTTVLDVDCSKSYNYQNTFTALTGQQVTINRSGADSNDPLWLDWQGVNYVALPGAAANYLSVPNAAALQITGDIDLRANLAMDDWTPTLDQSIVAKYSAAGNQRSYRLFVPGGSAGKPAFARTVDGTNAITYTASVAVPFSDGSAGWVRAVFDQDDGAGNSAVTFYTSADGTSWTQLGAVQTNANVAATYIGTADAEIGTVSAGGTQPLSGKVYRVQILNGINGTPVLDIDTSMVTSGSNTTFQALTGQSVVVNRSTSGRKTVCVTQPTLLLGTDDFLEVNNRWVDGTTKCVYLPGVAGNFMSVADSAALDVTGDIDIRVKVALDDWTPAATNMLLGKWGAATNQSYQLRVSTAGTLVLYWTTGGTNATILGEESSVATGIADGATKWVRATLDADNGASGRDVKFYLSDDGVSWTQLGITRTTAGVTSMFSGANAVEVGSIAAGNSMAQGRFYRAVIYSDLTGTTKVLDVDCSVVTSTSQTTFTEASSNAATVTINKSGTGFVATPIVQSGYVFPTGVANLTPAAFSMLDFESTDSFSVVVVARIHGSVSGYNVLLAKGLSPESAGYFLRGSNGSTSLFGVLGDGSQRTKTQTSAIPNGTLAVLGMTIDRASQLWTMFSGSTMSSTSPLTAYGSFKSAAPLRFGAWADTASGAANSEFEAVAVKRGLWTAAELTAIANYYAARNI